MLDHFHIQHHIKLFARLGHRFGRGVAIVDAQPRLGGVDLRHWNVARGGIGAHNLGPQPRHRF